MTDRHQITTSSDARTVARLRDLADRTQMSQADVLRMSLLMFEAWLDRNDPAEIPNPKTSRQRE
ncbi:MAG: hypothetical protein R6X31_13805 [Anaerolineae bacterium]